MFSMMSVTEKNGSGKIQGAKLDSDKNRRINRLKTINKQQDLINKLTEILSYTLLFGSQDNTPGIKHQCSCTQIDLFTLFNTLKLVLKTLRYLHVTKILVKENHY